MKSSSSFKVTCPSIEIIDSTHHITNVYEYRDIVLYICLGPYFHKEIRFLINGNRSTSFWLHGMHVRNDAKFCWEKSCSSSSAPDCFTFSVRCNISFNSHWDEVKVFLQQVIHVWNLTFSVCFYRSPTFHQEVKMFLHPRNQQVIFGIKHFFIIWPMSDDKTAQLGAATCR